MRGSLHASVLAFGPAGTGVIAWTQYRSPSTVHPAAGLRRRAMAGRSWSVQPRSFSLSSSPVFDGSRDGWTSAVDATGSLRFYATHDGGRSWTPTQSAAATGGHVTLSRSPMALSGRSGLAAAPAAGCRWVVMRGPASGDRLPATASQPLPLTNQNATTISAASATTAYVSAPARLGTVIYVDPTTAAALASHPAQCSGCEHRVRSHASTAPTRCGGSACRANSSIVLRTTNGGGTWSERRLPFVLAVLRSNQSAPRSRGQQDVHGTIYRTANGGASWQPVWRSGGPHGRSTPGFSPVLSAQSGRRRIAAGAADRGPLARPGTARSTNLIVYRTSDAGRSWQSDRRQAAAWLTLHCPREVRPARERLPPGSRSRRVRGSGRRIARSAGIPPKGSVFETAGREKGRVGQSGGAENGLFPGMRLRV